MNMAGETEPDLIVWQVGINDALAQAEITAFAEALDEILAWFRSHDIDAVLVEPPYTAALATDTHFAELIEAIRSPRPRQPSSANPPLGSHALPLRSGKGSSTEPLRPSEPWVSLHRRARGLCSSVVAECCHNAEVTSGQRHVTTIQRNEARHIDAPLSRAIWAFVPA